MSLNLNNPKNAEAATMSGASKTTSALSSAAHTAAALASAFGLNPSQWSLNESNYRGGRKIGGTPFGVTFHVFESLQPWGGGVPEVIDRGGRRLAKFSFPYVDGQTTDDLGRKGENFQVRAVLHGENYLRGLRELMIELNDPIPGRLIHPVRGVVQCKMEDYELTHSHEMSNAVMMHISFTEHNFDAAGFGGPTIGISSLKSAIQGAINAIQSVSNAIATVQATILAIKQFVKTIKNLVASIVSFYNNLRTLIVNINAAFNITSQDVAAVLSVAQGGTVASVNNFGTQGSTSLTAGVGGTSLTTGGFIQSSSQFPSVVSPLSPLANVPIGLLTSTGQQAIAQGQIISQAEGMRLAANAILQSIEQQIIAMQSVGATGGGAAASAQGVLIATKFAILSACDAVTLLLNAALASSRPQIINYTLPRSMSAREVAYVNGLSPDRYVDIAVLNPTLDSINQIDKGTRVFVPVQT